MIAGRKDLTKIISDHFLVINVAHSQCRKPNDSVHWCPDIVRHVGKESTLCLIGILRSMDCIRKCLIHFLVSSTIRHNQYIFLIPIYLTTHCNTMKPASFSCFLMNTLKIPFLLFMNLNLL